MSVFVQYDQWGRMGNRMFQYAFGYQLAKVRGVKFYADGLSNFNIPSTLDGTHPIDPVRTRSYGNNNVSFNELWTTDRDIVIDSFVQKAAYYCKRQDYRKLFNISQYPIHRDKLVVHIRETDYKDIGIFLGYDFYKQLIKDSGFNDVIICTDNSECDTVKRLIADGCTLNTRGYVDKFATVSDDRAMKDFDTLLCSENIAISQSSFSWWAAYLGRHSKIIFPYKKDGGLWKLKPELDDIDLFFNAQECEKFIL